MQLTRWEITLGLFNGILFGYRQYFNESQAYGSYAIEHVLYLGIFDICLTMYYEEL
jgi:hypothetical protein